MNCSRYILHISAYWKDFTLSHSHFPPCALMACNTYAYEMIFIALYRSMQAFFSYVGYRFSPAILWMRCALSWIIPANLVWPHSSLQRGWGKLCDLYTLNADHHKIFNICINVHTFNIPFLSLSHSRMHTGTWIASWIPSSIQYLIPNSGRLLKKLCTLDNAVRWLLQGDFSFEKELRRDFVNLTFYFARQS